MSCSINETAIVVPEMGKDEWVNREMTALVECQKRTGVTIPDSRQIEKVEVWTPTTLVIPQGLTRGPELELLHSAKVLLWGGVSGANCSGEEIPTKEGLYDCDLDGIFTARRHGHKPFNMRRPDQVAWCGPGGEMSAEELMYPFWQFAREHHGHLPAEDLWWWFWVRNAYDSGRWLYLRRDPGNGFSVSWHFIVDAHPRTGMAARKFRPLPLVA